jgi:hypothetical protein
LKAITVEHLLQQTLVIVPTLPWLSLALKLQDTTASHLPFVGQKPGLQSVHVSPSHVSQWSSLQAHFLEELQLLLLHWLSLTQSSPLSTFSTSQSETKQKLPPQLP